MRDRWTIAAVAAGVVARLGMLVVCWSKPLSPDASFYLDRARAFTFLEPWAASTREPLWVAIVKIAAGPAGYPLAAIRVLDTILSIAVVVVVAVGLTHMRGPVVAAAGTAYVALSPRLITTAPRGLRENASTLLFLPVVYYVVTGDRRWRWAAAACAALIAVVRFELAPVVLVLILGRSVADRAPQVFAVALVGSLALAGPWLVANGSRYGDPMYASNVQATWFRNYELAQTGSDLPYAKAGYDGPQTTWSEYYLRTLGVEESAKRTVRGTMLLPGRGSKVALAPISDTDVIDAAPPRIVRYGLYLLGLAVMVAAVVGTVVTRAKDAALALVAVALGMVPYLPLANTIDLRLITHVYVVMALPIGVTAAATLESLRSRREVPAAAG